MCVLVCAQIVMHYEHPYIISKGRLAVRCVSNFEGWSSKPLIEVALTGGLREWVTRPVSALSTYTALQFRRLENQYCTTLDPILLKVMSDYSNRV